MTMTTTMEPKTDNGNSLPERVQTQRRDIRVVEDDSQLSNLLDTARFEHMHRIAVAMARASLIPAHLRGESAEETAANCFLVVNQALRWGLDPFIIAPETYVVGGKLAYQGKLIAAVVNSRAGLQGRLKYRFNGLAGPELAVTVSGRFKGGDEDCEITMSVAQGKTQNQMWVKDPEQKLIYSGVVKWARRFCPEVVLGVLVEDEAELPRNELAGPAAAAASAVPLNERTRTPRPVAPGADAPVSSPSEADPQRPATVDAQGELKEDENTGDSDDNQGQPQGDEGTQSPPTAIGVSTWDHFRATVIDYYVAQNIAEREAVLEGLNKLNAATKFMLKEPKNKKARQDVADAIVAGRFDLKTGTVTAAT